jgi:predicted nuclease of predicted toxin-antitoxin system
MSSLLIPGIIKIFIQIDYGFYQQMIAAGYQTLHLKKLITNDTTLDAQIIQKAVEQTVQDLINVAFMTGQPEQLLELLRENVEKEHERQRISFLTL